MLNLTQLLMRETPPPSPHSRLVRPMGTDPLEAGETAYRCSKCGHIGGGEDFYWRKKKNGGRNRLSNCKQCHDTPRRSK